MDDRNTLEGKVRKRARRDSIRSALLSALVVAGALPVAIAAPKVFTLIKDEYIDAVVPLNPKQRLQETASRLKRKGFIEFRLENGKRYMRITSAGKKELVRIQSKDRRLPRPRRWDRRWRIVIFDIPEEKRVLRNKIRLLVRSLGFECLQQSVWVYPYDCEEVIALLKADLKVGRDVLYLIADAIEFDRPLREKFNLPLVD